MNGSDVAAPTADGAGETPEPDGRSAPYRHDPAAMPSLARLADQACDGVQDPHDAGLRIHRLASSGDFSVERPASDALFTTFMYVIHAAPLGEPPDARLSPYDERSLFPVALREAGEDLGSLWLDLAGEVEHPVARARCWDIVFTLGLIRNRRTAAERAIRGYLDTVDTALSLTHQANGLLRAWTMARLVQLTDLEAQVITAMKHVATAVLDQHDDPHAAATVLNALIAPPPRKAPRVVDPSVDDLLDRALTAYTEIRAIQGFALLIRTSAGNGTPRAEHASRHEVQAMIAEASAATDPMIIRTLFSDAATAARRYGLVDLERDAVARLQAAPPLTWDNTVWEAVTPAAFFDWYLPGFRHAEDWRHALWVWLHSGPPSGSKEKNEANARQAMRVSIVSLLATIVLFRDGDLPSRTVNGDAAAFDRELVHAERQSLAMNGRFLARALFGIRERFGIPSHHDLTTFLDDVHSADPVLTQVFATALQLYWIGEYDASCHLVVPKVEAAARALLLELNEPVYRTAIGDVSGQFPGLGTLLPYLLANDFDPDWERFLRTFLLNDGSNVRNLVAHGFARNVGPIEAALALRAAALLILITNGRSAARDSDAVRAAIAAPINHDGRGDCRPWHRRLAAALRAARRELAR